MKPEGFNKYEGIFKSVDKVKKIKTIFLINTGFKNSNNF